MGILDFFKEDPKRRDARQLAWDNYYGSQRLEAARQKAALESLGPASPALEAQVRSGKLLPAETINQFFPDPATVTRGTEIAPLQGDELGRAREGANLPPLGPQGPAPLSPIDQVGATTAIPESFQQQRASESDVLGALDVAATRFPGLERQNSSDVIQNRTSILAPLSQGDNAIARLIQKMGGPEKVAGDETTFDIITKFAIEADLMENLTDKQQIGLGLKTAPTSKAIKTWQTPDGGLVHLPSDQVPPDGSVPYSKPAEPPSKKAIKTWVSPDGGLLYLPSDKEPPAGSFPYSNTFEMEQTPEGFKMKYGPSTPETEADDSTQLTKGARGKYMDKIVANMDMLNGLQPALENFSREYFTWKGRGKKFILNKLSKAGFTLGPEDKAFEANARAFFEGIEGVFNLYRKDITGAQSVMKELDMLRKSILNRDLSPDEFQASANRFVKLLKDAIFMRARILQEGKLDIEVIGKEMDRRLGFTQEGSKKFTIIKVE